MTNPSTPWTGRCGDPNNPGGPGKRNDGRPCKMQVIPGSTRCFMHGGQSPAAKIKAETQLALIRMPAIETLYRAMELLDKMIEQALDDTCTACGYPKWHDVEERAEAIKACRVVGQNVAAILDRTGLGPSSKLQVTQDTDSDLDLRHLTDDERSRMLALFAQYRALKEEIKMRLHGTAFGVPPAEQQKPGFDVH